jgi:hypothetical protein
MEILIRCNSKIRQIHANSGIILNHDWF